MQKVQVGSLREAVTFITVGLVNKGSVDCRRYYSKRAAVCQDVTVPKRKDRGNLSSAFIKRKAVLQTIIRN